MLPPDAPADWISPFLNIVAECGSAPGPEDLLAAIKDIESSLGRHDARRWAPRPIDIDILLYDDRTVSSDTLTIPHPGLLERPFVLTPLAALKPGLDLSLSGLSARKSSALAANRALGREIPLWMGIVNLTPDSFSDGGLNETRAGVEATVGAMVEAGVHVLDFGAESTRPGATPLTADAEWQRLEPALERTLAKFVDDPLRPRFSVDTYHAEVARRAIDIGIDMINDVGGLEDAAMIELAASSNVEFVAMHSLGLPADPSKILPSEFSAVDQITEWIKRQVERWNSNGIDTDRVIVDPGIGFGKNPVQSLEILRGVDRIKATGQRLLVGHSRKSFMQGLAGNSIAERDLATIGASMALCERGVDIIRVHNVPDHVTAYRGWAHAQTTTR